MLGFVLDARIRAATREARALDDVMRLAFTRYSGATRLHAAAVPRNRQRSRRHGSRSLVRARARFNRGDRLFGHALEWYGLELRAPAAPFDPPGWLGVKTSVDAGRLIVANVPRGTPAFDAGVNPEDEIVAIDDFRVAADQLDKRLESYKPGDKVDAARRAPRGAEAAAGHARRRAGGPLEPGRASRGDAGTARASRAVARRQPVNASLSEH